MGVSIQAANRPVQQEVKYARKPFFARGQQSDAHRLGLKREQIDRLEFSSLMI